MMERILYFIYQVKELKLLWNNSDLIMETFYFSLSYAVNAVSGMSTFIKEATNAICYKDSVERFICVSQ